MENFIINRNDAFLMLIDIQDRLFHAMTPQVQKMLKKNCNILLEAAAEFNIPVIVTEQYRKGLGETIPELAESCSEAPNFDKLYFDSMKDEEINKYVTSTEKKTAILTGIESHICVFQTALTLLSSGYRVFIAKDAVGSRRKGDWTAAMNSLASAGAAVYPTETIAFMIIEKAGTPQFKALSPLFR
jgi:nicotinamidase-related amidase